MSYKIIEKIKLNSVMWKVALSAPIIARAAQAGQFVVVKIDENGERIPLTINDADRAKGTITIIFQEVGVTTKRLAVLCKGDAIDDILGPLGHPTSFGTVGKVLLIAGGVGIAEILPIAKYAKEHRNNITTILGVRTKELLILEEELKNYSGRITITTDDGSYGVKGLVIDPLKTMLKEERFNLAYVVGPDIMMKSVCEVTKTFGLKTLVSLDANMLDATGLCATCRVHVGGKVFFTCVDGPEFDGHLVDWDEFLKRQKRFINEEKKAIEAFRPGHKDCMYKD